MASEQISSAATIRPYTEANFQILAPAAVTLRKTLVPTEQKVGWVIRSGLLEIEPRFLGCPASGVITLQPEIHHFQYVTAKS